MYSFDPIPSASSSIPMSNREVQVMFSTETLQWTKHWTGSTGRILLPVAMVKSQPRWLQFYPQVRMPVIPTWTRRLDIKVKCEGRKGRSLEGHIFWVTPVTLYICAAGNCVALLSSVKVGCTCGRAPALSYELSFHVSRIAFNTLQGPQVAPAQPAHEAC